MLVKSRKNRDFCGGDIFETTPVYHSGINHGLVRNLIGAILSGIVKRD
ncbi:MAG: hypothetical protein ACLP7P_01325 [Rhodomicrobium sp.]